MISSNALSVFLLRHPLNWLRNENLRSVQEVMRASKTAADKYKNVCEDFPNIVTFTKSSTPVEIQLMFGHTVVGNKSLEESIVAFALAGDLGSPSVISFYLEIAFSTDREKIRLPIAEVLLRAAAGNIVRSNNQRNWKSRNSVLLPPFLTESAILHGELDAGDLLNIFARSITEWASDTAPSSEADEVSDNDSGVTVEAAEAKKQGKTKQASAETAAAKTLASIADDCDDVLAFLQAVAVKSPRVLAAPLSLRVDKRARVWFQRWTDVNLPKPPTPSSQDHLGLTDVLTNVATRLHTAEALCPVLSAQREM